MPSLHSSVVPFDGRYTIHVLFCLLMRPEQTTTSPLAQSRFSMGGEQSAMRSALWLLLSIEWAVVLFHPCAMRLFLNEFLSVAVGSNVNDISTGRLVDPGTLTSDS